MQETMSISVNGQSQVPPGFRFHPTEEELLHYYLRKKVSFQKIDLDVIPDVDLNKLEPWDIQERCKIGTTPQNDWYFFSHKDKKYPTGTRTNRATAAGFWKATGRDKVIFCNSSRIGMRKTLVFYKGRAPHGQKSDWIMHEYRLDDNSPTSQSNSNSNSNMKMHNHVVNGETGQEEGWVVCRIFKKKNHHRTLDSPLRTASSLTAETSSLLLDSCNDGALDQIIQYIGTTCKDLEEDRGNSTRRILRPIETSSTVINGGNFIEYSRFSKLPSLESPNSTSSQNCYQGMNQEMGINVNTVSSSDPVSVYGQMEGSNWAAFDRLVASQLNGQMEGSNVMYYSEIEQQGRTASFPMMSNRTSSIGHDYSNETELWSFARLSSSLSSSDPLCHVSDIPI